MDDNQATVEQMGFLLLGAGITNTGEVLALLGRYDEAEALLAKIGRLGIGNCTPGPLMPRAIVALDRGRYDEVAGLLADIDLFTAEMTDLQNRGGYHLLEANNALELGRPDDAWEHVEQALALAAGTDDDSILCEICASGARALADRVVEARARGRRVDAEKAVLLADGLIAELDRVFDLITGIGGAVSPRSLAWKAMCEAERSRVESSDAQLWAEAAGRWDAVSEPYRAATCRWREAEAPLEKRADRRRAGDALQQAWRAGRGRPLAVGGRRRPCSRGGLTGDAQWTRCRGRGGRRWPGGCRLCSRASGPSPAAPASSSTTLQRWNPTRRAPWPPISGSPL